MSRGDDARYLGAVFTRVLAAIARVLPEGLAEPVHAGARLDIPERSVKRYIAAAVEAELLVVTPDAGAAPRRPGGPGPTATTSQRGRILCGQVGPQRNHLLLRSSWFFLLTEDFVLRFLVLRLRRRHPPSGGRRGLPWCRCRSGPTNERATSGSLRLARHPVEVAAAAWQTPTRSSARSTPGDARPSGQPKRATPEWRRLAEYFDVLLAADAAGHGLAQEHPRPGDDRIRPQPYIDAHFDNRTELEVRKMMEEFVTARIEAAYHNQAGSVGVDVLHRGVGSAAARPEHGDDVYAARTREG